MTDAYLSRMRYLAFAIATLASACMTACGVAADPPPEEQATVAHTDMRVELARDVEPILLSGCSGEFCHRLTSASRAYAFLVNQPSTECDDSRPLVMPGHPERSYVVDKILGRNLCAGHPMPRGLENQLSADEVRTITEWISEGALDD
jgi:hypothetical protein